MAHLTGGEATAAGHRNNTIDIVRLPDTKKAGAGPAFHQHRCAAPYDSSI
jgi:hypothetical protein